MKQLPISILFILILLLGCTSDPPEPTGTFSMQFSGDFSNLLKGQSTFTLTPNNAFGVITVRLVVDENTSFRLSFYNPDRNQINLEPGTYRIVERLNENISNEVIVDYNENSGSYIAQNGQVKVGIVKPDQIKGEIENAEFASLNSFCSGSFDAIPE